MAEYNIVPTSFNSKVVELNIILDNSLVFAHLQIVDSIFSIGDRVNGSEVRAECADQSVDQSGFSSESKIAGSKRSRANPRRWDNTYRHYTVPDHLIQGTNTVYRTIRVHGAPRIRECDTKLGRMHYRSLLGLLYPPGGFGRCCA